MIFTFAMVLIFTMLKEAYEVYYIYIYIYNSLGLPKIQTRQRSKQQTSRSILLQ